MPDWNNGPQWTAQQEQARSQAPRSQAAAPQWQYRGDGPGPQYAPPQPQYPSQPAYGPEPKSRVTAGLLGFFFGAWGVHSFYLGRTGRGVAQIFVTLLTFGLGGMWGFAESLLILGSRRGMAWHRDALGRELVD